MSKIIFNYDYFGYLTGKGYADKHPFKEGEYIIPTLATDVEPPTEVSEGFKLKFSEGVWEQVRIQDSTITEDTSSEHSSSYEDILQRIIMLENCITTRRYRETFSEDMAIRDYAIELIRSVENQIIELRKQLQEL